MQKTRRPPHRALVEARLQRGWTQQQLADLISTTPSNINRWEQGKTTPSPHFQAKLNQLFGWNEQTFGSSSSETVLHPVQPALIDPIMPLLPPKFIARQKQLAALKRLFLARRPLTPVHSALYGIPGVGKTMLAVAFVHDPEIRQRYDGILWVGVGLHPHLPALLARWGHLLDLAPEAMAKNQTQQEWALRLRSAIGTRSILFVVDDVWEIESALTFLVGGPNCDYVLTTRFPDIAISFAEKPIKVEELDEQESLFLLEHLAPEVARERQEARTLVQSVGGLPLAVTLMGKYLHLQGRSPRRMHAALERLLGSVTDRLQLAQPIAPLEQSPSLPAHGSVSLQTAIHISEQHLSASSHKLLPALTVFPPKPNTFSEEAALAVCGGSIEELDAMIDSGLLEPCRAERYCLHQVIADYFRQHFKDTAAYDRLIIYYVNLLAKQPSDHDDLFEQEHANIIAALQAAYDLSRKAELVHGVCTFAPFLIMRGLYREAESLLQHALEAARELADRVARIRICLYLREVMQKQGLSREAEQYFQEGLVLTQQGEDPPLESALVADLRGSTQKEDESWGRGG